MTDAHQIPAHQIREEVCRVLYRYGEAVDRRDWDLLDTVFTPDAVADYAGAVITGLPDIRALMDAFNSGSGPSLHLFGNVVVDPDGPDAADARSSVRAFHQGAGSRAGLTYEAFGRYEDRLVRTAAGWRISRRRFVMAFENGSPEVLGPPG